MPNIIDMKAFEHSQEMADGADLSFHEWAKTINGLKATASFQQKEAALANFKKNGLPTTRHEEWKYTNLGKVLKEAQIGDFASQLTEKALLQHLAAGFESFQRVVIDNGHFRHDLSTIKATKGVHVSSLKEAFKKQEVTFTKHFGQLLQHDHDPISALNTAIGHDGCYLHIEKNRVVEEPILVVHAGSAPNSFLQVRNLMVIEENAEVRILELHLPTTHTVAFNQVSEIFVGKSARVDHYQLQTDDLHRTLINTTQVKQHGQSNYSNTVLTLGGKLVRNNLNLVLDGEYCEGIMNGLYLLDQKSHIDNHTSVDHTQPNSYSNELYKGLVDGSAKAVFNGKIFVRPGAQKTNAFQSNKNILLSDQASVDTKPQLEIWADDVKCSHGATTGSLDKEPLFYLKARGIPEQKAKGLLMLAFAFDVLEKVKIPALKELVHQLVAIRLGYDPE